MKIHSSIIFIFFIASFNIQASTTLKQLAQHPTWLSLGHYKKPAFNESYITNTSFFISSLGATSPFEELKATVQSFNSNPLTQCKYPARYTWLQKQGLTFTQPKSSCIELEQWRDEQPIHSISLIFASGYMSNPASLYGHLLLKLNRSSAKNNKLLDYSINYGAHVPDNENGLVYITKGLFGGYKAGFSDQLFYRHQHNYGEIELRDLWEYKLALKNNDTRFIANHLWEILGAQFDYYFADENCAFHIAQLIELVIGEQLTNNSSPWMIPTTVFSKLNQATYNNKKLVQDVLFTPSRSTVFIEYMKKLTANESNIAEKIYKTPDFIEQNDFTSLNIKSKKRIIETLFELVQLQQIKKHNIDHIKSLKKALIKTRLTLPIGNEVLVSSYTQQAPHKGQKPSNISVSSTRVNEQHNLGLGFRLSYFDSLASDVARIAFSNLEMVDTEVSILNSKVYLDKLHLLDLESFSPAYVEWPQENNLSWKINAGFERQNTLCRSCTNTFLMGGIGKSYLTNNNKTLIFTLANGYIGDLAATDKIYDSSLELGVITTLYSDIKLRASHEQFILGNDEKSSTQAEISIPINQNFDIRFSYKHANLTSWKFKLNYYWQ